MQTETTYHGSTDKQRPRVGLCLTTSARSAAGYATEKNGGDVITVIDLDLDGLTIAEAEYDFDAGDPIIPTGDYDVIVYTDSDMYLDDHETFMLMSSLAVQQSRVVETMTAAEAYWA